VLYVRTPEGKKKLTVVGFKPYFYVPDPSGEFESVEGERVRKIVCDYPEQVPEVRENYERHYEANIPFVHRFLIDREVYEGIEFDDTVISHEGLRPTNVDLDYVLCYLDIEVANKGTPITPKYVEEAPDAVICYTIYVGGKYLTVIWRSDFEERYEKRSDNWYVLYRNNETDALIDFASIIDKIDPDVLIAWNSSDFDIPYLKNRMKQFGIDFDWSKYAEFDLMRAYASFVLNKHNKYVALKDVGVDEGLITPEEKEEFTLDWWRFDVERLLRYNMRDVWLMVEIDKKRALFNNARMRRQMSGVVKFNDTFYPKTMIDSACLREAKRIGVVLPTYAIDKKSGKYGGGFVLQPPFGVYKNVAVFDFSRYYPSIMLSFKLDPLIYYRFIKKNGTFNLKSYLKFANEQNESIVLSALKKFMRMRDEIDAQLKQVEPGTKEYERLSSAKLAVKAIINAFYGVAGTDDFRLFSLPVAETVTAIGREGIQFVIDYVSKEHGFKVLYSDTDSIMVQVPRFNLDMLSTLGENITMAINAYFEHKYGVETDIRIKFEKFFRAVFFKEVKKRYSYWCVFEDGKECDYIGYKGFEVVRGDASPFTKKLEEEMFEIILKRDPKELAEWLPKKVEEFKKAKLSEIAIPKGINKPFEQYDSQQAHVRGAIYANAYLGETIVPGRTVYFMYVRSIKGKPKTDVVSLSSPERFDELADIIEVDWDRMIECSIESKVRDIFAKFGLPFSLKGRQLTLF